jgi:hypothetical protein
MRIAAVADRMPDIDPVDLTMTFLTGTFGLLATDEAPQPAVSTPPRLAGAARGAGCGARHDRLVRRTP